MNRETRKFVTETTKWLTHFGLHPTKTLVANRARYKCTVSNPLRETTSALHLAMGSPHRYSKGDVVYREYPLPVSQQVIVAHDHRLKGRNGEVTVEIRRVRNH